MEPQELTPDKALVVYSPRAGRSTRLSQALDYLRQAKMEIAEVLSIRAFNQHPEQEADWRSRDIGLVIAAGGDGLVGGVIPHVLRSRLPLGILPLGTANDVARTVGIPMDLSRAVQIIATGRQREIDLGLAYLAGSAPAPMYTARQAFTPCAKRTAPPRLFAHALTVGLNVQFARLATDPTVRQQYGSMTYPYAVFEALRNYKPIEVEVTFEGLLARPSPSVSPSLTQRPVTLRCLAAQATVVNAPVFWGVLQATVPGVSLKDRLLNIVVVEDSRPEDLILRVTRFVSRRQERPPQPHSWHAQYPALLPAELTDIPGIHHVKASRVTIRTRRERHQVTLDGEVCGHAPVYARVAERRLRLIVPAPSDYHWRGTE